MSSAFYGELERRRSIGSGQGQNSDVEGRRSGIRETGVWEKSALSTLILVERGNTLTTSRDKLSKGY